MGRRKRNSGQTRPTASPASSPKSKIEAGRDMLYIGERWGGDEEAYVLSPTSQRDYAVNLWYEDDDRTNPYFIVQTQLNPTAASLLHATSVVYHIQRTSLYLPVLNVDLSRSDVIQIKDQKYFWCDMEKWVVVVPYVDPIVVIPQTGMGMWGNRVVIMVDEEGCIWKGGEREGCYWFKRQIETAGNQEEEIESSTIETMRLLQSEMRYTRDACKWYEALYRIKQVFRPLLALLPLALFETEDNRLIVELATPNQKQHLRAIVPFYTNW